MRGPQPPALAERLASALLPSEFRDTVLGDWREDFVERQARSGRLSASIWYWSRVFSPTALLLTLTATAAGRPTMRENVTSAIPSLRLVTRAMWRNRSSSTIAAIVLALGIGGATAIFSAVRVVVLAPLEFDAEDRVVAFWSGGNWSLAEFEFARDRSPFLETVAGYAGPARRLLAGAEGSELVEVSQATGSFFDVFGATASQGRLLSPHDERHGGQLVAVLSHDFWLRRFGGDREVVGATMILDGESHVIVGVAPEGFWYPSQDSDLWVATQIEPGTGSYRFAHFFHVVGRRHQWSTAEAIQPQIAALAQAMHEEFQYREEFSKAIGAHAESLRDEVVGDSREPLLVLLAAVGSLLLIACANVAGIQVNGTIRRMPELAVRRSLGATRGRVAAERLMESLVLAGVGGGLGVLVAFGAVRGLAHVLPPDTPRLAEVGIDGLALVSAIGVAFLAAIVVGVAPALVAARTDLTSPLRQGVSEPPGPGHWRRLLVVAQTALAVVLVASAGLLSNSLMRLVGIDPGFDAEGVATLELTIPAEYPDEVRSATFGAILERVGGLPGVTSAGAVQRLPLSPGWSFGLEAEESSVEDAPGAAPWRGALPGYFETLGIEVVRGRGITSVDRAGSTPVAVINERLAQIYWPGMDPIGRRLRATLPDSEWLTVVGVVEDTRVAELTADVPPTVYQSYAQFPTSSSIHVLLRQEGAAASWSEIRAVAIEEEPQIAVGALLTMEQVVGDTMRQQKGLAVLMSMLAAIAFLLGIVGLFGVVSQIATRRNREIGLRLTLGSGRTAAVGLVLREGIALGVTGVGLGMALAIVFTRVLEGTLYGITATDPTTLLLVMASLVAASVVATAAPAMRASRIDPWTALREEG